MRFIRARAAVLAAILVAAGALAVALRPAVAASTPIQVRILFDLGDGTTAWASASIQDPTAPNATWDAALSAAASLGLWVSWTWYACCGAFITDIGNRSPPSGGVGVFVWNATRDAWDLAPVGISALVLRDGDAVALSDNAFDPVTYSTLTPVPTPDHPTPATEFRGDASNTGVTSSTAPEGVGLRWDRDLHLREIPSSPAVAFGRVCVLTLDGLFALDEETGAVVWSDPGIQGLSTPAIFNGTVILGGRDGRVHAVDAGTGAEVWNTTLLPNPVFSGVTSSPKILFDTVYVGTFNETGGPGEVVALWATNGTLRWRQGAPGSVSYSSPAIRDGALYAGVIGLYNTTTGISYDPPYGLLSLDASTGTPRWFARTDGPVAASPVLAGDLVIVPSKDGEVYAWNATDGAPAWKTAASAGVSSPALHDGVVYVAGGTFGANGGRVAALDAATGAVRWSSSVDGPVQASVTFADGELLFSTNTQPGSVYALDAATGVTIWSYTPIPANYILGSPVAADGIVFAPSDNGHVYSIGPPAFLLGLNVSAPASVSGSDATITVRVTASNGTAGDVWLNATLLGLDVVASEPVVTARVGVDVDWYLGSLPMGSNRTVSIVVRGNVSAIPPAGGPVAACLGSTCTERIALTYTGYHGSPYAAEVDTFRVQLGASSSSAPGPDPAIAAAVVLVGVAAVAAALALRRRRVRRAP